MRLSRTIFTVFILIVILAITIIPAFADANNQVIYLQQNQQWTDPFQAYHNINYYRCGARCHSVYPVSGVDQFKKIQCKVTNISGTIITFISHYILDEEATTFTSFILKDGYLGTNDIYFYFRGNAAPSAYAVVSYKGTIQ